MDSLQLCVLCCTLSVVFALALWALLYAYELNVEIRKVESNATRIRKDDTGTEPEDLPAGR